MTTFNDILAKNIVLVTDNINPSVFNMLWFVQNNIFAADEVLQDSICVPGFTSISTKDSQITIVPNQIQLSIKCLDLESSKTCVYNRFKKLIQQLYATPIKAVGINFVWKIYTGAPDFHVYTTSLFGKDNSGLYSYFSKPDSRLGAYFSQNVDKVTRLKLDMKPVTVLDKDKRSEFLLTSFNYHSDVKTPEEIAIQLEKWEGLFLNSQKIVCLIQ